MQQKSKAKLLTFAILTIFSIFAAGRLEDWYIRRLDRNSQYYASAVNCSLIDLADMPTSDSPARAKSRGQFWASLAISTNCRYDGVSLALRKQPEIFRQVFPGYEDWRNVEIFWKRYFARAFNIDTYVYTNSRAPGEIPIPLSVAHSWQGNVDLFATASADVIIVGSSQTFRLILPQDFATLLGPRLLDKSDPKVLIMAGPDLLTETVRFMITNMPKIKAKAKFAVFGYTPKMAFLRRLDRTSLSRQAQAEWRSEWLPPWPSLSDLIPLPTWRDLIGPSITAFRLRTAHHDLLEKPGKNSSHYVSAALTDNPILLRQLADTITPDFIDFRTATDSDCNMQETKLDFERTIHSLKTIADNLIVYFPPATPLFDGSLPHCFRPAMTQMVHEVSAREGVTAITEGWHGYGLDWEDYVTPTDQPGIYQIDAIHTNPLGSKKATKGLADLILHQWPRTAAFETTMGGS